MRHKKSETRNKKKEKRSTSLPKKVLICTFIAYHFGDSSKTTGRDLLYYFTDVWGRDLRSSRAALGLRNERNFPLVLWEMERTETDGKKLETSSLKMLKTSADRQGLSAPFIQRCLVMALSQ